MDAASLNLPRWPAAPSGSFHEVWFVSASDPRAGLGLWLRYTVDVGPSGRTSAVWGAWFDRDHPDSCIALKNEVDAAAIGRTGVDLAGNALSEAGCSGEVEGAGRSLRWRLSFGQGAAPEQVVPLWLSPLALLRGSGYALPRPATTLTGAVEVDGRMIDVQRMSAGQAHYWGRSRWPSWAWARCSAFAEDPGASLDLLEVEGPGGVRVPLFTFRFRGHVHRFGELPWMPLSTSRAVAPVWHFAAQHARVAIDGVVQAAPGQMVQVSYGDALHCANTEIANMEVRVRTRALVGAPWRPEATLTSKCAASLEFCGRTPFLKVIRRLVAVPAVRKEGPAAGSVAS
ncbi:MAG TPA: hypothetical protein VFP52_13485 [Myxococcales bacterium]|nr:hypothetical protein [Myxococcales bacterium]